jgi:S1-C subfamily serine protease
MLSLAQRLQGERLRFDEAAGLVEQLARAVDEDRRRGVLHPNLAPASVQIACSPDDGSKVTEWGIQIAATESDLSRKIGHTADVYSLGAILYECLTARPPFASGSNSGGASPRFPPGKKKSAQEPVPPKKLRTTCPRELETICLKCLRTNPRKRYTSALELAKDLRRFLDGEPIKARPPSRLERVGGSLRRHKILASFVVLLLVGGGVAGGILALSGSVDSKTSEPSAAAAATTNTGGDTPPAPDLTVTAPRVTMSPLPPEGPAPLEPKEIADNTKPEPANAGRRDDPSPLDGKIAPEALERVKRATVLVKVTTADGIEGSGSGFFGVAENRNQVLTNAHVVGMLPLDSQPPRSVEVVLNSGGQAEERHLTATVLGVDRAFDLALLEVPRDTPSLPEPLRINSGGGLRELTPLYTFGYPLGERLGKEVTIRETKVTSLRRKNGALVRVQVDSAMNPGNSGGPVVDVAGHVVGVAVAIIQGTNISFAIPVERVHSVLNGRVAGLNLQQPFAAGGRVGVPVAVSMIDPRHQVRELALELWAGNKPPADQGYRPASETRPVPQKGDLARQRYTLPYSADTGEANAELWLPRLAQGKVYWVQPTWLGANAHRHWGKAEVYQPPDPVERKPARLILNPDALAGSTLKIDTTNTFRAGIDEDEDDDLTVAHLQTNAVLHEEVTESTPARRTVRLQYQKANCKAVVNNKPQPDDLPPDITNNLQRLAVVMTFAAQGNLAIGYHDPETLRAVIGNGPPLVQQSRQNQLGKITQPVQRVLNTLSIPLPGKEDVEPRQSWTFARHTAVQGMGNEEWVTMDITCSYLGRRHRAGKDEAVVGIEGVLRGPGQVPGHVGTRGKASGTALVDLETGQATQCNLRMSVGSELNVFDPEGHSRTLRVVNTQDSHLERGK